MVPTQHHRSSSTTNQHKQQENVREGWTIPVTATPTPEEHARHAKEPLHPHRTN